MKRFDGDVRNDLFAVAKNEPARAPLEPLPWTPPAGLTAEGRPWRETVDAPREPRRTRRGRRRERAAPGPGWARIPGEDLDVTLLVRRREERSPRPGSADRLGPTSGAAVPALGDCSAAGYEATFAFRPGDAGAHEIVALFRSKDGRERHYPPRKFTWQRGR